MGFGGPDCGLSWSSDGWEGIPRQVSPLRRVFGHPSPVQVVVADSGPKKIGPGRSRDFEDRYVGQTGGLLAGGAWKEGYSLAMR